MLALNALLLLAQAKADPLDLPELQMPLTIEKQFLTLKELVSQIKTETNAAIDLSGSVPERKLDVFVTKLPARQILKCTIELFHLVWSTQGSISYLRLDPEVAKQGLNRQAKIAAARVNQKKNIRLVCEKYGGMPRDQIAAASDSLFQDYSNYTKLPNHDPDSARKMYGEYQSAVQFMQEDTRVFGSIMNRNPDLWADFWGGRTVLCASNHQLAGHRIPKAEQVMVDDKGEHRTPVDVRRSFTWNDTEGQVQFRNQQADTEGNYNSSSSGTLPFPSPQSSATEAGDADTWEKDQKEKAFDFELMTSSVKPSQWFLKKRSLGDHWEWMHQQSHLNVIAEAFRRAAYWSDLGRQVGSLRDWLTTFRSEDSLRFHFAEGVLQSSSASSEAWSEAEPSEAGLRSLESVGASRELTILDYAAFVAPQTNQQMANGEILTRVPLLTMSLVQGYALKFIASLPVGAQRGLAAGNTIDPITYPGPSRKILRQLFSILVGDNAGNIGGDLAKIWTTERLMPLLQPEVATKFEVSEYMVGQATSRDIADRPNPADQIGGADPSYDLSATKVRFGNDETNFVSVAVMAPMNQNIANADAAKRKEGKGSK